jgi:hypothetical protein
MLAGKLMTGARIFVAFAYIILGASFLASTGLLIREFQALDWQSMILAHSHLFLFFPLFGLLALIAFYLPSVVFAHFYWNHLPYGRLRFTIGLVAVAALSFGVSKWLDAKPRAIWEVSPAALAADRGDPQGCSAGASTACRRSPVLTALANLRATGQTRVGLSKFARNCAVDDLLETPEEMAKERYCFAAGAKMTGADCCQAQRRLADEVASLQEDPSTRSLSGRYDAIFLPLKIFFVLIVIAIGALLAVWRRRIDQHYSDLVPAIERGVIIGALAMLIWPAMDYGYQQTTNVLFGRWGTGPQLRLSLVIAPWALVLLFYFLTRLGKKGEIVGQVSGVVVAAVAVLRYEDLNDWAVRLLGIGSSRWIVTALFVIALLGFLALLLPRHWHPIGNSPPSS